MGTTTDLINDHKKVILFIGTHRTGTLNLAKFFSRSYPDIRTYHQSRYSRFTNVFTTLALEGAITPSFYEKIINYLVVRRVVSFPNECYLETSGFNYVAADLVRKVLPNTYIIQMIRDPRDFVVSYLNWIHGRFLSRAVHQEIFRWNVRGYKVSNMTKKEWREMEPFSRYCWYWVYKNQLMESLYKNYDKFMQICFEDLYNENSVLIKLKQLLAFISLDYVPGSEKFLLERRNESRPVMLGHWTEWSREQCAALDRICGPMMMKYGYGQEQEWKERVEHS